MSRDTAEPSAPLSAAMTRDPVLRLQDVSVSFGGVRALDDVSFEVRAGEVVALVGDNGAGKSTTIKVIAGNIRPEAGTIEVSGAEAHLHGPQDAVDLGIATVYQDLALCDNLDAVLNLFLGRELRRRFPPRLRRGQMEARAREVLAEMDVKLRSLTAPVSRLSGGQRQAVAISRVLLRNPAVVLLDEPTAALGVAQRLQVRELIGRLRDQGKGVILISHDLGDVREIADRVVVLRLGRVAARFDRDHYSTEDLVAAITGARDFEGAAQT
jgi:D-xylose transport system ATP-binding protein